MCAYYSCFSISIELFKSETKPGSLYGDLDVVHQSPSWLIA